MPHKKGSIASLLRAHELPIPRDVHAKIVLKALVMFNAEPRRVYTDKVAEKLVNTYLHPALFGYTPPPYPSVSYKNTTYPVTDITILDDIAKAALYNAKRAALKPVYSRLQDPALILSPRIAERARQLISHTPPRNTNDSTFFLRETDIGHMGIFVDNALSKRPLDIPTFQKELEVYYKDKERKENCNNAIGALVMLAFSIGMQRS